MRKWRWQNWLVVAVAVGLTLPNGVATAYTYDSNDRVTQLLTTSGQNTLASFRYTLDALGKPTAVAAQLQRHENGQWALKPQSIAYSYDDAYRLLSETRMEPDGQGGQVQTYSETFTL